MNKNTSPKLTPLTVTLSPGSDSKLQNYKAQAETLIVQMWLIMLVDNHSTTIDDQPCNETSRLLFHIKTLMIDKHLAITGWQKLCEGPSPKGLDFKP